LKPERITAFAYREKENRIECSTTAPPSPRMYENNIPYVLESGIPLQLCPLLEALPSAASNFRSNKREHLK
jgi:hypothetical protein